MEYEKPFKSYIDSFNISEIDLATIEEIKYEVERQLWNKIGREVGEFKIGDCVVEYGEYCYKNVDEEDLVASKNYDINMLNGFYPAESFISFK